MFIPVIPNNARIPLLIINTKNIGGYFNLDQGFLCEAKQVMAL